MAALDPQAAIASIFSILKTDSAGTSVRAALGAGANSVIPRQTLADATLPASPFVVGAGGAITGDRRQMRDLFYTWLVYDDPTTLWRRINAIVSLIEAAYTNNPRIVEGYVIHMASIGAETIDDALNRPYRSILLQVRTRR
jgi:hypothetical protein